jgi:hypothetical protein
VGRNWELAESLHLLKIKPQGIARRAEPQGIGVKRIGYLFSIIAVLFFASLSSANIIFHIDVSGPNDPGSGTSEDPFRRIQAGIDAASGGDTVLIQPGVYSGLGNYNLNPSGKAITICSIEPDNTDTVARTIIDPNREGRGFIIQSGEDANCVISGLTVRNAFVTVGNNGAGIYCYDSSPTIRSCVIRNSLAESGSGGGICFDYGNPIVINCIIADNVAGYYGGGISSRFALPTIAGCTIIGNTAGIEGGGVDSGMSDPNIFNCIIYDNNAIAGGGINCYYSGVTNAINCTIVANSAKYAGGAVFCWYESSVFLKNSILWANSALNGGQIGLEEEGSASVTYCNIQGGQATIFDPCGLLTWGQGNIDADPCFASFDPNGDPNLWDLHLKSSDGRWNHIFHKIDFNNNGIINLIDFAVLGGVWMEKGIFEEDLNNNGTVDRADLELFAEYYLANSYEDGWILDLLTSSCVDAGDPNSDWAGEPWPNGKRINMGFYGGTNQAGKSGNPADFDVNGEVNLTDFAVLAGKWMIQGGFIEDLNNNGVIDYADVSEFSENWLWQKD